jgi:uncharacterized protein (TIGR01777 family)
MGTELIVERRTPLPVPPEQAFAWYARPGAIDRLLPPWLHIEVLARDPALVNGSRVRLRIPAGPFVAHWTAEHQDVEPGRGFSDVQVSGPFEHWTHRVEFAPDANGSILHDRIACRLPAAAPITRARLAGELERLLRYRHAISAADLQMHAAVAQLPRQHVAMTGTSGFIGSLLLPALTTGGHRVTRLVRHEARQGELRWDPAGKGLDPASLRGVTAVIHLAGENIGARWTAARKRRIMESRRTGTRLLAEAIARAPDGPRVLVSASAVGYYGNRDDELLTEASGSGSGFLPEVVRAWEESTGPAAEAGARVVRLRTGLPLSPAGGVLQRMLLPFRLGLGGRLGSGRQWMSWISADDLVGAYHHALMSPSARGPLNAVAPAPVRNAELTRELGRVLHRAAVLPVPAFALRALFGQMADEAILASTRVAPEELLRRGYRFRHETLGAALQHVLGRTSG